MLHRLYYSPGIFGFGRLASYDYFAHVERALETRFREAGQDVISNVVGVLPTASVRRRAAMLSEAVNRSCGREDGPIHLLGHSTGGLDARLVASPSAVLPVAKEVLGWLPRLRSVTTMNTPHFGTPLAKFFATVNGQRILYALSALTVIGLSIGAPPLAAASALVGLLGRTERSSPLEWRALDAAVEALLRVLNEAGSLEVRVFLDAITQDQGAVLQLTPEAMDLFQAGVENRAGVSYQSTASMAPLPSPGRWLWLLAHPSTALSVSIFTMLHRITARADRRYPCAAVRSNEQGGEVWAGAQAEAVLARSFAAPVTVRSSDGVVPTRSQLWGTLAWAGFADHLDVLGHFRDERPAGGQEPGHRDWLSSGSYFDRAHFAALMDAIASGMLEASG